jgi:hypothetical protein
MISENLLFDPDYNSLSVQSRELFIRMLIKTDDYGILPAHPYTLGGLLNLDNQTKDEMLNLIEEIEGQKLIKCFFYNDSLFFAFKKDRFDEYQSYVIKNRCRSEYLRLPKEDLDDGKLEELVKVSGNFREFPGISQALSHRKIKDKSRKIKEESKKEKEEKKMYGTLSNVLLTLKEYDNLVSLKSKELTDKAIEFLSLWIAEKGYKSKSHNLAIQRWVFDAVTKDKSKPGIRPLSKQEEYENTCGGQQQDELDEELMGHFRR